MKNFTILTSKCEEKNCNNYIPFLEDQAFVRRYCFLHFKKYQWKHFSKKLKMI